MRLAGFKADRDTDNVENWGRNGDLILTPAGHHSFIEFFFISLYVYPIVYVFKRFI